MLFEELAQNGSRPRGQRPLRSATLPWCFAEEATPATEALLDRLRTGETAVVPAHWPTEVVNGLAMAGRRGRIDLERVARFALDLAALPIRIESAHSPAIWNALIRVADEHHLTAYDAAYLELAQRTGLPFGNSGR